MDTITALFNKIHSVPLLLLSQWEHLYQFKNVLLACSK